MTSDGRWQKACQKPTWQPPISAKSRGHVGGHHLGRGKQRHPNPTPMDPAIIRMGKADNFNMQPRLGSNGWRKRRNPSGGGGGGGAGLRGERGHMIREAFSKDQRVFGHPDHSEEARVRGCMSSQTHDQKEQPRISS